MFDPTPIQRFVARVGRMAALRQGDLRLTLAEATELSASLAGLLATQAGGSSAPEPAKEMPSREMPPREMPPREMPSRDSLVNTGPAVIDGGGLKR